VYIPNWSKQVGCGDPGTLQAAYGIQCSYFFKQRKIRKRIRSLNELSESKESGWIPHRLRDWIKMK
jgi:hypothetical protein